MKKKIFGGIAILAIAAVAVINVNLSSKSNDLSSVSLANIEALAQNAKKALAYEETSECPNGCYPNGSGCYCNGWWPCEREA
ncbi:MAG: NVEALA domain-containing protein [Prevotellaceae bacterium]|jgi:hypothetical protein|nr:NVEALA domain-containing protein [Prevotellaceae bacterium]